MYTALQDHMHYEAKSFKKKKMEGENELFTHTGDWYSCLTKQQQHQKQKWNKLYQTHNWPVCQTKQNHDSSLKKLVIMDDISNMP